MSWIQTLTSKVSSRGRGPELIVEEVTVTCCSYRYFSTLEGSDQQSGLLFPHETSGSLWVIDHLKKPITWEEPTIPTLKLLFFPPTQAIKLLQADVKMDTGRAHLRSHSGTLIVQDDAS